MKPSNIKLAEKLSQLPERELVEVIYKAIQSRNEDKELPSGDFEYDRWCLAQTSFGRFEGNTDQEPYVELVGLVSPAYEHVDWKHLCQSGKCKRCNALVTSVSKIAVCPCCSADVECT